MKLSVLDVAGVLEETVELVRHAETLGFARYWVADGRPQPTPVLHLAILAGLTERIRVGTHGLVLDYYSPLRRAYDFELLERVYPDRIDVGFSSKPSPMPPLEDLEGQTLEDLVSSYPARLRRLVGHLGNVPAVQLWSDGGAELGVGLAHSLLRADAVDAPAVAGHRPAVVVVAGVCANTVADAERIAAGVRGEAIPRIIGDRDRCRRQLAELAERYAVDEIVFADLCPDLDARLACYTLLAG
ncbi:MAG TPA: LLM class flavin-dependent oxidoreductase [Kofleriaceae bacterium]